MILHGIMIYICTGVVSQVLQLPWLSLLEASGLGNLTIDLVCFETQFSQFLKSSNNQNGPIVKNSAEVRMVRLVGELLPNVMDGLEEHWALLVMVVMVMIMEMIMEMMDTGDGGGGGWH